MKIAEFDYNLPSELIAQKPAEPRDASKLLILDKNNGCIKHSHFLSLTDYFQAGDILVINNSKVIPARLMGTKLSGGAVEIFLNHQEGDRWQVLGKKIKVGQEIAFEGSTLKAFVKEKKDEVYYVEFSLKGEQFFEEIEKIGKTPIPPYIKRISGDEASDEKSYQTIFAKDKGSVAAPTAGLHFTEKVFQGLREKGVEVLEVTLHVGLGTFAPVKAENIEDHHIHSEFYSIDPSTLDKIKKAKADGHRIIAVGTTTTRVLETIFSPSSSLPTPNLSGWTNIYIYPGYQFKCIDGIITNFHLPKSSLLLLISAFAGQQNVMKAYEEAIGQKYRFYSYGDAMLII